MANHSKYLFVASYLYVASNELRSPGGRQEFRFPNKLSAHYIGLTVCYVISLRKHVPLTSRLQSSTAQTIILAALPFIGLTLT